MSRKYLAVAYHILLFITLAAVFLFFSRLQAQPARDLAMEYRKTDKGFYAAILRNRHAAAATAYIAQASFRLKGKQEPMAFGGDTLAYPSGGFVLPPESSNETNNTLPEGAEPLTTGIMAAIYADGFTEGDQSVIQMLLSGRHRSLLDLPGAIDILDRAAAGGIDGAAAKRRFEEMRERDVAEAKELDEMISVPGVRHGIFMTAVPSNALARLQGPANLPQAARALAEDYRKWLRTLRESKPPI